MYFCVQNAIHPLHFMFIQTEQKRVVFILMRCKYFYPLCMFVLYIYV